MSFAAKLLKWFDAHGRHDFPWQKDRTPYRVWLSEVMLQQTQAATVIPYYGRFLEAFPTVTSLADAHEDEVFALWSGLGYYSRARNLHRTAQIVRDDFGGEFPDTFDELLALPGVGRSTAGAIMAQAYGKPFPILDGNVKRLLARYHGIREWTGTSAAQKALWSFAAEHLPSKRLPDYTQAQMDFGSIVCRPRKPLCASCPLRVDCVAFNTDATSVIPAPKPRKVIPTRTEVAALLVRDDRVLLVKRPPSGIWSSLWTLPQFESREELDDWVAIHGRHGKAAKAREISHVFSHFKLKLMPWRYADFKLKDAVRDDANLRWVSRDELLALGIPAPIRILLSEQVFNGDE